VFYKEYLVLDRKYNQAQMCLTPKTLYWLGA